MDKKLETRNYIRKQDAKPYLGLGIISWILICIWIIYHPNWSFENNRDFLELKGDTILSPVGGIKSIKYLCMKGCAYR